MTMRIRATTLAILLAAGASCAGAQDGKLLFSSGFEQGTVLRPIVQGDCWASGCFQYLEGTDTSTGFSWPPAIWGGGGLLFLLADAPVDAATIHDYFFHRIVPATGRRGLPTRVLYSLTPQSGCCGADGQLGGATAGNLMLALEIWHRLFVDDDGSEAAVARVRADFARSLGKLDRSALIPGYVINAGIPGS